MTDDSGDSKPRPALNRDRVLVEAVRLADAEGIEAVAMRRLGRELGAGAMSLYHYVSSKDDLLDGMVDLVFAEIEAPSGEGDWRAAMRRRSVSARDVLLRHSWAVALMESRTNPGPANLQHREAVTACLRRAGFSIEMTVHANWLLDSYVYGFVIEEASLPFDTAEELADMADDVYMPLLPPEQYPYLNEVAGALLAGGYDHRAEFAFGLNVILDALDRLRSGSESTVGGS
jgi:AcrR family transcriptional regulator